VPRITRAQAMDALSSQAALAGYYAAAAAATNLNRILPIDDHRCWLAAPGTGAGDGCGCSRSAGAGRLPSAWAPWWKGYDVRPEVKEQVESVGGKFV